jgi:hypothetical protein
MTLLLAGAASLALLAEPGFAALATADYCSPFALGALSLEDAAAGLAGLGFAPRPLDDLSREAGTAVRHLSRADGDQIWMEIGEDGRLCEVTQARAEEAELPDALELSGRWWRLPKRADQPDTPWLSVDGRLVLYTQFDPTAGAFARVAAADQPPDVMLAARDEALAADRRSPGQALIWAFRNMCPSHGGGEEWADYQFLGSSMTQTGGLRGDLRHRDPQTIVAWFYASHCVLAVKGPGQVEAVADLRGWLNESASGWSSGDQADTWTQPGLIAVFQPVDNGEAMSIEVRLADAPGR